MSQTTTGGGGQPTAQQLIQALRQQGLSVKTLAAAGIHGFGKILEVYRTYAPLRRNVTQEDVGDTGLFLISSLSRGITGEVIHVDGGFHVLGFVPPA